MDANKLNFSLKKMLKNRTHVHIYNIVTILVLFSILILIPSSLQASKIKGRFYISDYYSSDSGNNDFNVLTSKLKIYKREDNKSFLSFNINGRYRTKISDRDVNNKIPEYRFQDLWIGYKLPQENFKIKLGRQLIGEMYNTSIDGLNVKYFITDKKGFGVFGGLAPDKYDNSFNTKFSSFGLYGFFEEKKFKLDLGYENLHYKGKTDREYFSTRLHSDISSKLRLYASSSISVDQISDSFDIERVSTSIQYTLSKAIRFNVFYNYYRAIKYFESSKQFFDRIDRLDSYYLDTNSLTRVGMRADYKVSRLLRFYTAAAYQKRELYNQDALRFTLGVKRLDFYGFDISGRYRHINNYTSTDDEFNVNISKMIMNKLDISVYASHEEEELEIEGGFTSRVLTYGTSLYWQINRHFFAMLFVERYDEQNYYNTSVFTQVGYRL